MPDENALPNPGAKKNFSPVDKAAILLMSMGERDAAEILKQMGPKEVQKVGSAMSSLSHVSQESIEGVLSSFIADCSGQSSLGVGSEGYIKNMLTEALGESRARGLMDSILSDDAASGMHSLKWMDARSVADAIRNEHPQIQAVVLSHLEPDQAANILSQFPDKERLDVVLRLATLESVQPDALKELNVVLEKQFTGKTTKPSTNIAGTKLAADIMNSLDKTLEAELMEAIKGTDDALKEKILGNMSKRAAEMLADDLEAMAPVRISEVEAAQKEILSTARRLSDSGEIQLGSGGGEEFL